MRTRKGGIIQRKGRKESEDVEIRRSEMKKIDLGER
jgi:hypothetical protein